MIRRGSLHLRRRHSRATSAGVAASSGPSHGETLGRAVPGAIGWAASRASSRSASLSRTMHGLRRRRTSGRPRPRARSTRSRGSRRRRRSSACLIGRRRHDRRGRVEPREVVRDLGHRTALEIGLGRADCCHSAAIRRCGRPRATTAPRREAAPLRGLRGSGAYRDRTGDLRLANPPQHPTPPDPDEQDRRR